MSSTLSKALAAQIVSHIRSSILEQMEDQPNLEWDPWNEQEGGAAWLDNELCHISNVDWSIYNSVEEVQKKLEGMHVKDLKMIKAQLI